MELDDLGVYFGYGKRILPISSNRFLYTQYLDNSSYIMGTIKTTSNRASMRNMSSSNMNSGSIAPTPKRKIKPFKVLSNLGSGEEVVLDNQLNKSINGFSETDNIFNNNNY